MNITYGNITSNIYAAFNKHTVFDILQFFMKPVKISREMQKFTGMRDDQLVSRVDVTKAICQYVKTNNLQNQSDRRQFTPDEKLGKLLGTSEPLTYYNLQKHIQPHFIKTA